MVKRRPDVHARASGIEDLEDVVDLEGVLAELHQDARVAPEDHDAFHRRPGRRGGLFHLFPLGGFRNAGDENHA